MSLSKRIAAALCAWLLLAAAPVSAQSLLLLGVGADGAAGGGGSGASIAAYTLHNATSGTNSFTFGTGTAAAGDLLVVHMQNQSAPTCSITSGSMGTPTSHTNSTPNTDYIFSKALASSDITTPSLSCGSMTATEAMIVVVVKGAGSLNPQQYASATGVNVSLSFSAVTSGASLGALMTVIDGGFATSGNPANTPGSWTFAIKDVDVTGYFRATIAINAAYSGGGVTSGTYPGADYTTGFLSGIDH